MAPMTFPKRMSGLLLVLASLVAGCDGDPASEASLVVRVRTDYAPGEDFTGVVARLGTTRREVVARRTDNYATGVDLQAFEGLTGGETIDLDVELIDTDGVVARSAVVVSLEPAGVTRATVVIGRPAGDAGALDAGGLDAGAPDAGPEDGGHDAGPRDAGFDAGPPPGAVGYGERRDTLIPADFACRGAVAAPPEMGESVTFTAQLEDFQSGTAVEGLTVDVFGADFPTPTCEAGCAGGVTDATGAVTANDVPGSWFAYRVRAGTGTTGGIESEYVEVLGYHLVAPPSGGSVVVNGVQQSTLSTLVALLGVSRDPGTASLLGTLSDCGGEPIANARVRVFDASGEIALGTGGSGPREFYFASSGLPSSRETSTNVDGLFGATNFPVPSDGIRLRVELWGSLTAGAPPALLGCEAVEGIADGVTIVDVGPRRSDGPMDCSP